VPVGDVTRPDESRAISNLLTDALLAPSALVLEGEPGIGKTTLWLSAVEEALTRGFRVLSARPAASESVMAYTALADLLGSVAPLVWADLPSPQRLAIDRVTLRATDGGDGSAVTDQRAVSAALVSVVELLAHESPVLLAIDDLQWLDASSMRVLGFVARRLSGPVGLLGAVRTTSDDVSAASWLQLPRPEQLRRITLRPLTVGALHAVISKRLGRSYPRPTMLHVHETSGGNPFYAIELARAIDDDPAAGWKVLPRSLTELVNNRIDTVDDIAEAALLASSCLAALGIFDDLGTPLWAARARSELERTGGKLRGTVGLTPSEQRVAELAAAGMTNRDMAAALFISPKTVEANLSRVYRKLGIHSRAELGAVMSRGT
jgi:DNA-binding CsgD family transcriptional regulator